MLEDHVSPDQHDRAAGGSPHDPRPSAPLAPTRRRQARRRLHRAEEKPSSGDEVFHPVSR